jgi:hypothetical protein
MLEFLAIRFMNWQYTYLALQGPNRALKKPRRMSKDLYCGVSSALYPSVQKRESAEELQLC